MNNTIKYYNENSNEYIESTYNCDMTNVYEMFNKYLKENSKIIDLGFGSGRDSLYYKSIGYEVLSVDPSKNFINRGVELGLDTIYGTIFDVIKENYYDAVFACASLLHIKEDELNDTFKEISKKLKKGGILYCSFKYGEFIGERNGRYFIDLNESNIKKYLPENLMIIENVVTKDAKNRDDKWLNIIVKKYDLNRYNLSR